jgi:hypothetical protein
VTAAVPAGDPGATETRRRHAAWLRECARRSEALAAEYRANADRIDPDVSDPQEASR